MRYSQMNTLRYAIKINVKDNNAAFHRGLNCLLTQNQSSEKEMQYFLEVIMCAPSIYRIDHSDFIVCGFMENSIGHEKS